MPPLSCFSVTCDFLFSPFWESVSDLSSSLLIHVSEVSFLLFTVSMWTNSALNFQFPVIFPSFIISLFFTFFLGFISVHSPFDILFLFQKDSTIFHSMKDDNFSLKCFSGLGRKRLLPVKFQGEVDFLWSVRFFSKTPPFSCLFVQELRALANTREERARPLATPRKSKGHISQLPVSTELGSSMSFPPSLSDLLTLCKT